MNATTEENLAIANTIAAQIGHRAFLMMGTRHKLAVDHGLLFDVRGSDVGKVEVTLTPMDTYTVKFYGKSRGITAPKLIHESENIYADGLNQCIEYRSGLRLSLYTPKS